VFAGGFDLDAAEAVVAADAELLESLVDKSLVHVAPGGDGARRFALLETIRTFASDRLANQPHAATLRAAHATHYLQLAEEQDAVIRTAEQLSAFDWYLREIDNLRAAAAHLVATDDGTKLGRLAAATSIVMPASYPHEHWTWVERALELGIDDAELRSRLLRLAALDAFMKGRTEIADRYSRELVADAEMAGSARVLGLALETRGIVVGGDEGRAKLRQALELAESSGDTEAVIRTAANLGAVSLSAGLFAEAAAESQHALEIARSQGNRKWMGAAQANVATASYFLGDFEMAAAAAREARELADALHDRYGVATTTLVVGAVAAHAGDRDQASRDLEEAEAILRELGASLEPAEERLRQELHELLALSLDADLQ
jgi:non-specific serine/threonine protein kinase